MCFWNVEVNWNLYIMNLLNRGPAIQDIKLLLKSCQLLKV